MNRPVSTADVISNPKDADENAGTPEDETQTSPEVSIRRAMIQARLDRLTRAQRRVYDYLMEGASEKQAASRLHVSIHTVHSHTKAIYKIFGITTRAELLAYCTKPATRRDTL